MKIVKTYNLLLEPNFQKLEDIRYSSFKYKIYLKHFITQLYHQPHLPSLSTKGMGILANKAQAQARNLLRRHRAGIAATGNKSNCPLKSTFKCTSCSKEIDADFNASINIARKGQENLDRKIGMINPLKNHQQAATSSVRS